MLNIINKIKSYLQDSWQETRKVNWLTKDETIKLTIEVILFSLTFALIYGVVDSLLAHLILLIVK